MNIITMRQGQYAIKKGGGAFIIFLKELLEFKKDASRNLKKIERLENKNTETFQIIE